MKKIKLILFPIGSHDTAGNKRLNILSKYLHKNHEVEVYTIQLRTPSKVYSKFNPLFYILYFTYSFINIFYVIHILVKQKKSGAANFLYFYEGNNIRLHRIIIAKLLRYKILIDLVENPNSMSYVKSIIQKIKTFYFLLFYKNIPLYANGLVVVSKYLKSKTETDFKNRIPVYHLPVSFDPDDFNAQLIPKNVPTIFYGGSYGNNYDFDSLFISFNEVVKDFPALQLCLSGKVDASVKEIINKYIQKQENIVYLGFLDEAVYYQTICSMDILCMPRNNTIQANAGFPFKLAEYLATGNAVIASRVSDIAEYLTDNDAFIYEAGDYKKMESIIRDILKNNEAVRFMGDNGKKKAEIYFGAGNVTAQFYDYLVRL